MKAMNEGREGFRKTKLGWIPQDWKVEKISNLFSRIRESVDVHSVEIYQEIGIRSNGKGIFHKEFVTGEMIGNKSVFWVVPDCLILNIVFAWEQAVAKTTQLDDGRIASHRFPMFKAKKGKVNLDYALYFFKSPRGKHSLGIASPGGAGRNKTLGQSEFQTLVMPIPSYHEQKKIAEILGTWDKAIELTEKLIDAKTWRKKGLMQQLLKGKKRFVGFTGKWERLNLGKVSHFKGGNGFKNQYQGNSNGDLPFIKVSDMANPKNKLFIIDSKNWINKEIQEEIGANVFLKEAIVFAKVGAAIFLNKRRILTRETLIDNNMMWATPKNPCFYLFLYYVLCNVDFGNYAQEGALPSINQKVVSSIKIDFPFSITEQKKIASALFACDKEIELLQKKMEALQQQKKALMQKLLTGTVRVSVSALNKAIPKKSTKNEKRAHRESNKN